MPEPNEKDLKYALHHDSLVNASQDGDIEKGRVFLKAAQDGDIEKVRVLLQDQHVDPTLTDNDGRTALMLAAMN